MRSQVIALAAFFSLLQPVWASPIVRVGPGRTQSWTQAFNSSNVRSVPDSAGFTAAETAFYSDFVSRNGLDGFERKGSTLTPDFGIPPGGPDERTSLVMSWDQPDDDDDDILGVCSWEYRYDDDPDLTGLYVLYSVYAPPEIQDVSVILIDDAGRSRGWFRAGVPAVPAWENYAVDTGAGLQGPFTFFFNEPGFDLTRVLTIRFNESSLRNVPFQTADPTGNGEAWNAWNFLEVPEPSAGIALTAGIIALIVRRKTRAEKIV